MCDDINETSIGSPAQPLIIQGKGRRQLLGRVGSVWKSAPLSASLLIQTPLTLTPAIHHVISPHRGIAACSKRRCECIYVYMLLHNCSCYLWLRGPSWPQFEHLLRCHTPTQPLKVMYVLYSVEYRPWGWGASSNDNIILGVRIGYLS